MNYQETTEYLFNSTPVFEKLVPRHISLVCRLPMSWTSTSVILIVNIRLYILPAPTARVPALIR